VKPVSREQLREALPIPTAPLPQQVLVVTESASSASALILLAEDNEANITTISDYLRSKGYRLAVARNGEEALEQTRELSPDLVLMDVQMPKVDGLSATRQIREDPELESIPIIALTALAMQGDRERILEAGANEYMAKPVSLRNLVQKIETLLQPSKNHT
jgi:CheY-like chemotaxis protein